MRVPGWDYIHISNCGCTACTTISATNCGGDISLVVAGW